MTCLEQEQERLPQVAEQDSETRNGMCRFLSVHALPGQAGRIAEQVAFLQTDDAFLRRLGSLSALSDHGIGAPGAHRVYL